MVIALVIIAPVIGCSFRFFSVAVVLYYYGAPVTIIEKYFDIAAWGFMVLLILGFPLLKLL